MARVYIVILNWNGWRDTIECLESVFRLEYPQFGVIVCDNASSDDSLGHIRRWARGEQLAECKNPKLAHLVFPPIQKPIPVWSMDKQESTAAPKIDAPLILIQTGANLGFAGGCNVGLRYALAQPDCDYVWLLNNDTVVDPQALTLLVDVMRANPRLGMSGSLNLSYYSPDKIQLVGGCRYDPWTGRAKRVGEGASLDHVRTDNPERIDSVQGTSMLVTREFLQTVGLMEESYFLYCEELDWAMRARGTFEIGCSPRSMIYHKEGASIGSNRDRSLRSPLSEQYGVSSRILFTGRYYPALLPFVLCWVVLATLHRLVKGNPRKAKVMGMAIFEGLRKLFHSRGSARNGQRSPAPR
jgi:GT2 family glycosyltransferase